MNIHEDFEEFLRLLVAQQVKFVIVGGYAVAFYGYVRATQDLDLFFCSSDENVRRVVSSLHDFGLVVDKSLLHDFRDPGSIIRMGFPPIRIEMINRISGLTFDEVWERRVLGKYGAIPVSFISFADLLVNKKASGRLKDLADIDELGGNR